MNSIELYKKQLAKALLTKNVESYEDIEGEDYENLRMRGGFGLPQFKQAQRRTTGGLPGNVSANSFVAQYDFKVYYSTIGANPITDTLPVPLFMPLHEISLYNGIDLPSGISITGISVKDKYELSYSKTDKDNASVTIEGLTSSWGVLQRGIVSLEEYDLNKIRLSVGSGHEQHFFTTFLKLFGRTSLGKTYQNDSVPFISQQSPLQYDKTKLDLDVKLHIQKDSGLIYGMPSPATIGANAPITFSVFISGIARK